MHRIARDVSLVLVLCGLVSVPPAAAADVEIVPDVVYGHKDGLAMTFDVLKPKAGANGAAVIYMVSGGWVSMYSPPERTAENPLFAPLLERGFTVIALRHGSSPKYLIPEIVADVRRGVRYIRHHARQWGVDPERLGLFGASAGGHLSLVLGTAPDGEDPAATEEFMRSSNRVAAVVAYFPPVDLRNLARGLVPPAGTDGTRFPALNFEREQAPAYSPILHVTPDDPPTLLIHGDSDTLVPISNSQNMYKVLQETSITSEFITMPGAGHGFRGEDATKANAAMVSWFERTLVPQRSSSAQR